MNVGFISTRLAGTDGVSLETAKLATIIRRLGHRVFYCAGELDADAPPGLLIPEMHFAHREAKQIHDEAFSGSAPADLRPRIESMAARLYTAIHRFVEQYQIDVLVLQNALAIPMHIPLGGHSATISPRWGCPPSPTTTTFTGRESDSISAPCTTCWSAFSRPTCPTYGTS